MQRLFQRLNEKQREAVLAEENCLVSACPGSGKTRVLTTKLIHEVQKLKNPKHILVALTFTNRAADEIRNRLDQFNIDTENIWSGTIHSFCLEWILRPYSGACGNVFNGFHIIDDFETEQLIADLKTKYCINKFDGIRKTYNLDGTFNVENFKHLPLLEEYKSILRVRKMIDFDDVLYYSYRLLINYPSISLRLSNLFPLICIDEYQDTQELQYAIISEIVKANNNHTRVFFVGDVCQAIYGSLGGVAKGAKEICRQFGNIEINELHLEGNYRSNQRIINYYSNFQINSLVIKSKVDQADYLGTISYNTTVHKENLPEYIANLISHYLNKGISPNQICVLAPQWWMIIPMGRKIKALLPNVHFDALGLSPFRKVWNNTWYKAVKLFLTNPTTSNYTFRSQWANEFINDVEQIVPDFLNDDRLDKKRFLLRLTSSFIPAETSSLEYVKASIAFLIEGVNLDLKHAPVLKERLEAFYTATERELIKEEFQYANEIGLLKRLFNSNKGVLVNTCHGVKGEEYEVVIAFGLIDGFVPNWKDPDKEAAKKLLYVICSRAKNYLHLISEQGHITRLGPRSQTPQLSKVRFSYDIRDLGFE